MYLRPLACWGQLEGIGLDGGLKKGNLRRTGVTSGEALSPRKLPGFTTFQGEGRSGKHISNIHLLGAV